MNFLFLVKNVQLQVNLEPWWRVQAPSPTCLSCHNPEVLSKFNIFHLDTLITFTCLTCPLGIIFLIKTKLMIMQLSRGKYSFFSCEWSMTFVCLLAPNSLHFLTLYLTFLVKLNLKLGLNYFFLKKTYISKLMIWQFFPKF